MISEYYLHSFQKELIKSYQYLKRLLDENGLRYFAYGGTCIGAVRHGNIIPWDDDIDILMPRDDYYRFLSLKKILSDSNYDIISYRDRGYYFPFAKFVNKNTTIWEHRENPFLFGAYVDVFPLYYTNQDYDDILRTRHTYYNMYCKASRSNNSYSFSRIMEAIKDKRIHDAISYIISKIAYSDSNKYLSQFEAFESAMPCNCGKYAVSYASSKYGFEKEIFDAEWFSDYIEMPFATSSIRVPKGYDQMLSFVFGDYMKLPPIDKRTPDHNKYYVNLKEGLSIEQVAERLKHGETCVF